LCFYIVLRTTVDMKLINSSIVCNQLRLACTTRGTCWNLMFSHLLNDNVWASCFNKGLKCLWWSGCACDNEQSVSASRCYWKVLEIACVLFLQAWITFSKNCKTSHQAIAIFLHYSIAMSTVHVGHLFKKVDFWYLLNVYFILFLAC